MKIFRNFLPLFLIFLFSALTFFVSCDSDTGVADDLEQDFTSKYTFYSYDPNDNEDSKSLTISYPIGKVLTASELPSVSNPDIFAMNIGYEVDGWVFLRNPRNGSTEIPETIKTDSENDNIVTEITVTSEYAHFVVNEWKPITYYIDFNGNGATSGSMQSQEFTYDDFTQSLTPNAFVREKYDFVGWGWDASQIPNYPNYTDGETITENLANRDGTHLTLYALWLRSNITITFNANANDGVGGEVTGKMGEQEIVYKELPTNLTMNEFEREGHTFTGWSTASDGNGTFFYDCDEITINNYPDDDMTLYAQWQINSYQVNFYSNGGSYVETQTILWNQNATKPENPTRTGYDFAGWFTSSDGGATLSDTEFDFTTTTIKEDTNLYAKWTVQTLKISFDKNANDVSGTMSGQEFTYEDLPVTLTEHAYDRTKTGYYFAGWNTNANGTEYYFYDQFEITQSNWDYVRNYASGDVSLTLYAQWQIIQYNVYFDTTGGLWTDTSVSSSQWINWHTTATEPTAPKRAGYTFAGWFTSTDDGATLSEKFNFSTAISENITLYAKWNELALTITFNANGGSGRMAAQTINGSDLSSGQALSASTFEREGYYFWGWSKSESAETVDFADSEVISDSNWENLYESGGVTLYAVWNEISYYVYFETNGGSEIEPQTLYYWKDNRKVTKPNDPTRTGYTFAGWYADYGCTTAFDFNSQIPVDSTMIYIYAKWEAESLTVNFYANGGTGSMTAQTITYDQLPQSLNANNFSKEGYNFTNWNTIADGSGTNYSNGATISASNWQKGTLDLYAQWEIQKFKVSFITNDGSAVATQIVEWNKTAEKPSDPTRTGYTFSGWYADSALTMTFNFSTQITTDTTIYAKWTPNTYTVIFDGNGATTGSMAAQTFTYGISQNLNTNTYERNGYNFLGWSTSSTATSATYTDKRSISVSEDMILYAVWAQRATVTSSDIPYSIDEENEQIIFTVTEEFNSYMWFVDFPSVTTPKLSGANATTLSLNFSDYSDGNTHTVVFYGTASDGTPKSMSTAFKIAQKLAP